MRFVVKDYKAKPVELSPRLTFEGANTPKKIYEFFKEVVETDPGYEPEKEHVIVICLNTRLNVNGWHLVSIGSLTEASCHPREIFRPVIVRSAHSFVLCHNHPSGDPSPSRADEEITKRMSEAAELLQIHLADHVIIGTPARGRNPYFSFREAGLV
ncbi:MAG: JAB domain-containing protein [Luteolibacter sp.]